MGRLRTTAAMLALLLAVTACGGDGDDAAEVMVTPAVEEAEVTPTPTPTPDSAVAALLAIITERIEAALGGADFAAAVEGQELAVGDQVRTDDTGFAEVTYHDGSWQRVEAEATLTIVELASADDADVVRTRVDIGRSWNNVRALTVPEDLYELETPVATASVRGTVFATECPSETECTFIAVEGTILITPVVGEPFELTAPARVTIGGEDAPPEPDVVAPDALRAEPWISANLEQDETRADDLPDRDIGAVTNDAAHLAAASMDGTWQVTRTVTARNAEGGEEVVDRTYVFETTCGADGCASTLRVHTVEYTNGQTVDGELVIPVAFDGSGYSGTATWDIGCPDQPGHGATGTFLVDLRPTAAERTVTGWRATGFDGTGRVDTALDPACFPEGPVWTDDGAEPYEEVTLSAQRDD